MMIDLRTDAGTRPAPEIYRAMVQADLGDDVLGDDPTVRALEELAAERMDKPAAVFMPSGTMANLVTLRLLAGSRGRVFCERTTQLQTTGVTRPPAYLPHF